MGPYNFILKCDALIDQNRQIGSDPVGHKCMNDAMVETITGILLCQQCYALFMSASPRLTIRKPYGKGPQIHMIQQMMRGKNDQNPT